MAAAPLLCESGPLTVGWQVGPLDGVAVPRVQGVVLAGISDACAALPIRVSLTDGTGGVIATAEATAGSAVGGVVRLAFPGGVAIPPIEGISVTVPDAVLLTVELRGAGSGSVTSGDGLDGALDCPAGACERYVVPGSVVTLTASATTGGDPASRFDGWRGVDCAEPDPTSATCTFTVASSLTVGALFGLESVTELPTLTSPGPLEFTAGVEFGSLTGEGTAGTETIVVQLLRLGDVTAGTAGGIGAFPFEATAGTLVVDVTVYYLESGLPVPGPFTICLAGREPDRLWHFTGGAWSDVTLDPPDDYATGSDGTARVCGRVADLSPFAVASWAGPRRLSVDVTGSGTVTSSPAGLACRGAGCAADFSVGQSVTLTATPDDGWAFAGWTGRFCSGTGTCVVRMAADRAVGAAFQQLGGGGGPSQTATSVTLRKSAGTISSGTRLTLTARLSPSLGISAGPAGSGLAGRRLALERSTGSGWLRIATLVTGVDGTAATSFRPVRNAAYRAVFAGDGAYAPGTSGAARVNVRYVVALSPAAGRSVAIARTASLTVTATVRPEPSAGTGVVRPRVTFDLFRRVGGRWSLLTRTTVAANARGVATWRFRPPAAGKWAIRAAARSSASNYESTFTGLLTVVVR